MKKVILFILFSLLLVNFVSAQAGDQIPLDLSICYQYNLDEENYSANWDGYDQGGCCEYTENQTACEQDVQEAYDAMHKRDFRNTTLLSALAVLFIFSLVFLFVGKKIIKWVALLIFFKILSWIIIIIGVLVLGFFLYSRYLNWYA